MAADACTVADPSGTPLNVRKGPNGPIVGALNNGILVVIRGRRGDWVNVVPHEAPGKSGWVWREYKSQTNDHYDHRLRLAHTLKNCRGTPNVLAYVASVRELDERPALGLLNFKEKARCRPRTTGLAKASATAALSLAMTRGKGEIEVMLRRLAGVDGAAR